MNEIPQYGVYAVCPVCKKAFFVCHPDEYVYKRRASISTNNNKMLYFNKYSCKRAFDKDYEKYIFEIRQAAAIERHKKGRPRKPVDPEKKAEKDAEIDRMREGKHCKDCMYAYRDKFGFWYCSFSYVIKAYKVACKKFRPGEVGEVHGVC